MTGKFPTFSALLIVFGGLLLISSGILYAAARASQATEQEKRDQHWMKVMSEAAQSFPRMLPGEEKPAPAPLPNPGSILSLLTGGTIAIATGIGRVVAGFLARSAILGETAAATPGPESPAR